MKALPKQRDYILRSPAASMDSPQRMAPRESSSTTCYQLHKHRGIKETEAESVAYVVAGIPGLDTSVCSIKVRPPARAGDAINSFSGMHWWSLDVILRRGLGG